MGRRHRSTPRRPADRSHRAGAQCGVQPRRAPAGQRQRGQHGAAVGRRHRPTARASPTGDVACGVQPRRAPAGQATTGCGCGTPTRQPLGDPLTGHTGPVTGGVQPRRAPAGTSAGDDGTVRLWNADTGEPPSGRSACHRHGTRVAFSPDGHRLAATAPIAARCGCGTPTLANRSCVPCRPRAGVRGGVQPRRAPAGQRRRGHHGADMGRRHRPNPSADPLHRPHRPR